jgi:uncharacterized protein
MDMVTATTNRQEIIDRIGKLRQQLYARGVERLALFGSFSRNAQHDKSDVDLLVAFRPDLKTFDNYMAVCELLEASLSRRVELLTTESLSPYIGPRILQEAEDVLVAN